MKESYEINNSTLALIALDNKGNWGGTRVFYR